MQIPLISQITEHVFNIYSKRGARIPPCLFNGLSLVVVVWSLGGEDHRIENRFKNPSELENRAQEAPEHEN